MGEIATATVFDVKVWEPPGIPLAPYSLKNKRRIYFDGQFQNKPSKEALQFQRQAALLWKAHRPDVPFSPQDALEISFVIRYPDYMRDFVGALDAIADALQKSGVVHNDRQIRAIGKCHVVESIGDPMTWVRLERIGELPWRVKI